MAEPAKRTARGVKRRRRGGVALVLVAALAVLVGGLVAGQHPAGAIDNCPNLFLPPELLPGDLATRPIQEGVPLSGALPILDEVSSLAVLRQVPATLPAGADDGWVLVSGYTPNPETPPPYQAWLCLGGKVPDVAGLPLGEALNAVVAHGLVPQASGVNGLDVATAEGWEVVTLDPPADTLLPFEDIVVVTAGPPATPTSTAPPPAGSGGGAEADSRSGGAGAEAQQPQYTEGDSPAAVRPGTATDADDVEPAATGQPMWPWLLVLALVGAVVTAALVRRAHRRRRKPHVGTRVRDDVPQTDLTELRGLGRSHSIRIETHRDDEEITLRAAPSAGPLTADPLTADLPTADIADTAEKG
jgi:hypothetical protein